MGALDGRVAIITGGGQGLGRAYARAFAAEGAKVVVGSRPPHDGGRATAEVVVDEIRAEGGEAVAHLGSVVSWADAEALVATALDTYGALDAVVNNAGVLRDRVLANLSEEEWDTVVDVHLKGYAAVLHQAAAYWRACHKDGRPRAATVVNMTAGGGLFGNPGQAAYAAAKAGVVGLTLVAARELERYGVRVNAVAPFARTAPTEQTPGMADMLRRPDDPDAFDLFAPENVAPLVAYLSTADTRFTGQVFDAVAGRVALLEGWRTAAAFDRPQAWTVDELRGALADLPAGPPPFGPTGPSELRRGAS